VLSNQAQIKVIFSQGVQKEGMKVSSLSLGKIKNGLEWIFQNMQKSSIPRYFLGIFEIFKGGKGTPDHRSRKLLLIDILPTHQNGQLV